MEDAMSSQRIIFLLVEDDHDHAVLVMRYIERTRIRSIVYRVKDGEEALAFLKRERTYYQAPRPDVILLDLKLPKYDGHEVLAKIKEDPELHRIPVVVLTTSAAELDRLKAYDLDASHYLVKPLNREEFSRMIEELSRTWGGRNQRSDDAPAEKQHLEQNDFALVMTRADDHGVR
jgi:CheY-like chemotaxis protein